MNSVVHTGVKSAGCENSNTHLPLEVKSLSLIMPCVDLASKFGAGSLIRGILGMTGATVSLLIISSPPGENTCCGLSDWADSRAGFACRVKFRAGEATLKRGAGWERSDQPHAGVRQQQHIKPATE
jgi:hypothetical protein